MLVFRQLSTISHLIEVPCGKKTSDGDIVNILYVAMVAGLTALGFALILVVNLLRQDKGDEKIQFIGKAIQEGAMAFLSREYRFLAIFVAVIATFISISILRPFAISINEIFDQE